MIEKLKFVGRVAKTSLGLYRLGVAEGHPTLNFSKSPVTLDFEPNFPVFGKAFPDVAAAQAAAQKHYDERVMATYDKTTCARVLKLLESAASDRDGERIAALSELRGLLRLPEVVRAPGPYFVRKIGAENWTVAVWENNCWWLPGVSQSCPESVFAEIGVKCEPIDDPEHWKSAAQAEASAHDEAREERSAAMRVLTAARKMLARHKATPLVSRFDALCKKYGLEQPVE